MNRMVVMLDVGYPEGRPAKAVAACWTPDGACHFVETLIDEVAPYEPGSFYKRELPCLLKVLGLIDLSQCQWIIVDGYVYLGENNKPGLGAHLYEALQRKIPVAGVAKTRYMGNENNSVPLLRGGSSNPLYVSAIGMPKEEVLKVVKNMKGAHRIPDDMKELDRRTRL